MRRLMMLATAGCGLWLAVANVWAQSTDVAPPDRVARLAVIDGSANLMPAGSQSWGDASINRPLGTGDKLWVPEGSRVSLEMGGTEIRLDGGSGFGFLHLGNDTAQAQLTSGTLNLNVRHLYRGQNYEIDTPTLAFVADHRGQYRIDIAPNGKGTQVTVFSGEAVVYGEGGVQRRVSAGNAYRFLDSTLAQVEVFPVPQPDSFDRWCFARDARYQRNYATTTAYVSSEVIGYQDLADYGSWQNEADYGPTWFPTAVPVGWAPYRYGHWAWIAPWGWTWIDDAPWGFAPFHYGRWAFLGGRWGWVPGPVAVRPIYAPALVAFVGFGGGGFDGGWGGGWNTGFGFGFGGPVGWYPLAPGAVFVPWYRCGPRYFRDVNVTNIHVVNQTVINNINNTYNIFRRGGHLNLTQIGDHRIPPRALTVVPHDVFTGARQVGPHALPHPRLTALRGSLALGAPPAPGRGSLMAPHIGPTPNVPRPIFAREVLAHRPPPHAIAALPQRMDGYRLAHGTAALPPMAPVRIAGNVRVIGARSGGNMGPYRHGAALPSVPRIVRAGPAPAAPMTRTDARQPAGLPSASFAPHRWQPQTLPAPARIEPAAGGRYAAQQPTFRRDNGVQVISGRPQASGGTFSTIGGNRGQPPAGSGNAPAWRAARPREPGNARGMQVIEAPRSSWGGYQGASRRAVPREPAYGQRAMVPAPPQFHSAPQPQFERVPQPQFGRAPQAFRQAPPQFHEAAPPQFHQAPPPRFRPAPAPREAPQPPHGGGR